MDTQMCSGPESVHSVLDGKTTARRDGQLRPHVWQRLTSSSEVPKPPVGAGVAERSSRWRTGRALKTGASPARML